MDSSLVAYYLHGIEFILGVPESHVSGTTSSRWIARDLEDAGPVPSRWIAKGFGDAGPDHPGIGFGRRKHTTLRTSPFFLSRQENGGPYKRSRGMVEDEDCFEVGQGLLEVDIFGAVPESEVFRGGSKLPLNGFFGLSNTLCLPACLLVPVPTFQQASPF